jgi:hypothetical protein
MTGRSVSRVALRLGFLALVVMGILEIPPPRAWSETVKSPFSWGPYASVGPAYRLLLEAGSVVPRGSTVVARSEPPNVVADTYFFRAAVALLPDRQVLPAAIWFRTPTDNESRASYLIVLGKGPPPPGFGKVFESPRGSVWKR